MSAGARCNGTPISWLALERHHAGELEASESDAINAHLASCAICAACLARIEADAEGPLAPLLPLPPVSPLVARTSAPPRLFLLRRIAPPLAALAVAAGVLLSLGRAPRTSPAPHEPLPGTSRTKGGDVAFALVRDDEGLVAEAGGIYRDGDRWKAIVTCPAGMRASWDLVVFERGEAAFPLAPPGELVCGNDVPLPGAFRTTGRDRMTVCLVWTDGDMLDRESLRNVAPDALPRASCKVLDPAP